MTRLRPALRHVRFVGCRAALLGAYAYGCAWLAVACGGPALTLMVPPDQDDPAARATHVASAFDGYRANFVLLWKGARIGEAKERMFASDDAEGGYRFEREERVVVRRGQATSTAVTRIRVDLDVGMVAERIDVVRESGSVTSRGRAVRLADQSWQVSFGQEAAARVVDGSAVPASLVPLLVAADGAVPGRAFSGLVLVEGSGLARADLRVDVSADRRYALASLQTSTGRLRAKAELDASGHVLAAGESTGVASRRASEAELASAFVPPEIVDSSTVPVKGAPAAKGPLHLRITGVAARPPTLAELTEQRVTVAADGAWDVVVGVPARFPRGLAEVRQQTHYVSELLQDDLGAFSLTSEEVLEAGRADCTGHALVLAHQLDGQGLTTRLVTGFRYSDGRLARHRWVLVKLGDAWVAVDPMYDEAPASALYLALAVHSTAPDDLAFVDDVAFSGWDKAAAEIVP